MYQRIGSSLPIDRGTTAAFEPKPLIEAYCLKVLLVHVGRKAWVTPDSILDESAANARSTKVRIDEQSLHVAAVEQHKTDCPITFIYREIEGGARKERGHFGFDISSVFWCEEVMRRVHCSPPNFHYSRAVGQGRFADFCHDIDDDRTSSRAWL
jgi:hypothetical protein